MGCSVSKKAGANGGLRGLGGAADASGGQAAAAAGDGARNVRVKLVLLGDSGVGKSCIVLRFVRGQFDANSKVTVGAAFLSQTVSLPDASTTVKFEIWDTAGQERYASLAPLYYRGASAAAVVYDITSPESFQKARFWVKVWLGLTHMNPDTSPVFFYHARHRRYFFCRHVFPPPPSSSSASRFTSLLPSCCAVGFGGWIRSTRRSTRPEPR